MRAVKIILCFLILQTIIFSKSIEMDKRVYYHYAQNLVQKLETGFEIQRVRGYCEFTTGECLGSLFITDPKSLEWGERNIGVLVKLNVDLSNFKAKRYWDISFKDDKLYFNKESDVMLKDSDKERIKKIKKMLIIHNTIKNIAVSIDEADEIIRSSEDDYLFGIEERRKIFSTYIVIKIPELSYPYFYVLDYENIDTEVMWKEYTGRSLDELNKYLKQFIAKNTDKEGKIPQKKYNEFMEKEIYETNFYSELTKEIFELEKDLGEKLHYN